jgi:hypothetical protein
MFAEWSSLAERPVLPNFGSSRSIKALARGTGRGIEGRIAACGSVVLCVNDGAEAHRTTVRTTMIHHRSHSSQEHDRRRSRRRIELEFSNRYLPHLKFLSIPVSQHQHKRKGALPSLLGSSSSHRILLRVTAGVSRISEESLG